MPQPISLTDSELTAIMDAARPLSPSGRDQFLRRVAEAICALAERGDGAVARAIRSVRRASFRQRRYVGAVEKRDLVRDVEKMTLARKREPRVRVQIGHRDPPSFSRVMTRPERSGKASNEQSFFLHSPEARGALSKQLNYLIA